MKYLVTGGAGFIGSHVADLLVKGGHEVVIVDDLSSGTKENIHSKATFEKCDIRDEECMRAVFEKYRPDFVYHFAAQLSVRKSVEDPVFDAQVNIIAFIHLLNLSKEFLVKKVIFASSAGTVYGDKEELPVPETVDTRPECPYGISKLAMEKYAYYYYLTYQLPYVALRFSNVYGPRQNPHGEAGVVGIFTERMLEGKECFINGDGETTRDFVYVDDVADACILALDEEVIGEYNISRGVQTSVNTIAELLVEYTEYGKEVPHREAKPGEQRYGEYDSTLYQEKTGWSPDIDIKTGLKQTVEWFQKHK
mgnify:CR=1 FL=1